MGCASDLTFRHALEACGASVRRTFADHVPLYLCTVSFAFVTAAVLLRHPLNLPLSSGFFFVESFLQFLAVVLPFVALKHLFLIYKNGRPHHPLSALCRGMLGSLLKEDRTGNLVHGFVGCTLTVMLFTTLKIEIVKLQPFVWDAAFSRAGQIIGFGTPLWQVLQPVFGHPLITAILSFTYAAWFVVMFGSLFWQISRPQTNPLRSQFLLAFIMSWFFVGFVLATVFSSAGPCFYGHIVRGPNPYAPLMQYLRNTREHWPIWTIDAQDMLWRAYVTGNGAIEGISAMPSMHVTIASLLALLGWRTNRYMGIGFTIFAAMIFVGSIMLGWHYSVDGIAGIALAIVFWFVAGTVTAAWAAYRARRVRTVPLLGAAVLE